MVFPSIMHEGNKSPLGQQNPQLCQQEESQIFSEPITGIADCKQSRVPCSFEIMIVLDQPLDLLFSMLIRKY